MPTKDDELKCPVLGHDHQRTIHGDGSLRCPKDNHRWVPATPGLTEMLKDAPDVILSALKPEIVQGKTYVRKSKPHWGWPSGWRPYVE